MTHSEAHRRAIEAGARALARRYCIEHGIRIEIRKTWIDKHWQEFEEQTKAAITAYLASMLLPISELPDDSLVYVMSPAERGIDAQGWIAHSGAIRANMNVGLTAATHFTFLPEPPK